MSKITPGTYTNATGDTRIVTQIKEGDGTLWWRKKATTGEQKSTPAEWRVWMLGDDFREEK